MNDEITISEASESRETHWRRILEDWKASGLRACEYQRRNNLNKHAFIYWKLKLIGRIDRPQGLIAVKVRRSTAFGSLRIRIGERYTVELADGFDAKSLREVLAVVRECPE